VVPQLAATAAHVVPSKIVNALAVGGAVLAMSSADSPIARMAASCDAISVVEPDDVDGAVAAACDLLDGHDMERLRGAARTYAAEHHDRDRLLRRLHDALVGQRVVA
jgi:glycosyltransferase involved in cell wall biosynthesis